jgi:hypothetical protein
MTINERAEEIFEYICNNTPEENGKTPWPHNRFSTLVDSAQEHYRHAARYHERELNVETIPHGWKIVPWAILFVCGLKFTGV